MEQVKIGFLAHSPAAANSAYPLITELNNQPNVELYLYPYHPYASKLWNHPELDPTTPYPASMCNLDILVYGTGSGHAVEVGVPDFGKRHGIKTISILDVYWSTDENIQQRFPTPPDYLVVPNQIAYEQIIRVGLMPKDNVLPLGNPHFDRLHTYIKDYSVEYPLTVSFFSQCSTAADFSDPPKEVQDALLALVDIVEQYPEYIDRVYVVPHPRENTVWLKTHCNHPKVKFTMTDSTDLLLTTDVSIGVACTLQYEAQMIGKPTVFFTDPASLLAAFSTLPKTKFEPTLNGYSATAQCIQLIQKLTDALSDTSN